MSKKNSKRVVQSPHLTLQPAAYLMLEKVKASGISRKTFVSTLIYRFTDKLLAQLGFSGK
jgi:hypothetical protein